VKLSKFYLVSITVILIIGFFGLAVSIENIREINSDYGIADLASLSDEEVVELGGMWEYYEDSLYEDILQNPDAEKQYDINNIDKKIIEKVQDYDRISIFFGYIFYNKGVDRLAKIWLDNFADEEKHLLIIAGKRDAVYKELDMLEKNINECRNILYINRFVENDLLNYLIDKSHIILLPYRHASMSGVVFTAAEFKKPVLATNTGSISEYLVDGESGFIVENDERLFMEKLKYVSNKVSKETLHDMGENLHEHIKQNYSWENIGELLAETVYGLEL
jgi:glycosyltransferase involved in cell wall biosynthesis